MTMKTNAQMLRYYLLNELRHTRARSRIGTASEATTRKDRRALQRDLVKLRSTRPTA